MQYKFQYFHSSCIKKSTCQVDRTSIMFVPRYHFAFLPCIAFGSSRLCISSSLLSHARNPRSLFSQNNCNKQIQRDFIILYQLEVTMFTKFSFYIHCTCLFINSWTYYWDRPFWSINSTQDTSVWWNFWKYLW